MLGVGGKDRRRATWALAALVAAGLSCGPALAAIAGPGPAPARSLPAAGQCTTASGSWPEYQGDPTHAANACSTVGTQNVSQLRPSWYVATIDPVTDTPAVAFGSVYAGDYAGTVYAVDRTTGREHWTFDTSAPRSCFLDAPLPHADRHQVSYGQIPASPAAATLAGRHVLFVAAGGSLYALDAATGSCLWAQDVDPAAPTNSTEVESSPVVDTALTPPEVIVGDDNNDSTGEAVTGLLAFNALDGSLLWKYQPERDVTLYPQQFHGSDALTLSCGDSAPNPDCNPQNVPGLAPNQPGYADGCGDVWSSPGLDTSFADPAGFNSYQGSGATPPPPGGWTAKRITESGGANPPGRPDGLVVFATGNCNASPTPAAALEHGDYVDNQAVFALDPVTGVRVWNFTEPYDQYDANPNQPGGADTDMGASPIIASLPTATIPAGKCGAGPRSTLVIEGSKSGYAYGICGSNGALVWQVQAAQPGQLSPDQIGALGGFLGSPSMGVSGQRPTVFFTSAIPMPFTNDGIREPGDGDTNITSCPGLSPAPLLPACPDLGLLTDPQRLDALHAVDAATGRVVYQAPSLPTYAASSYTNGVVFLPDSLEAGVSAYSADTGIRLWTFPLGAVPASAAAIAGNSIFLGTGEAEGTSPGQSFPPQLSGIWSFTTPT